MNRKYLAVPDWFEHFATATMVCGFSLVLSGIFYFFMFVLDLLFFNDPYFLVNDFMFSGYVTFNFLLMFVVLNKNLRFDWGLE